MATNFPSSVDAFTNPSSSDTLDNPPHDQQHADVNDAVEAIETALLDGAPLHIDDANERVGIGTATPTADLEVSASNPLVYITDNDNLLSDNAHSAGLLFRDSANSLSGGIGYLSGSNQDMDIGTWTPNGRLDFHTGSGATRMSIDSSGNVGINDTTPSYTLDVNGDINATGDVRVAGNPVGMVMLDEQYFAGYGGVSSDVLSDDFQHYMVQFYGRLTSSSSGLYLRFRRSGTDLTSTNYTWGANGVAFSTGNAFTSASASDTGMRLGSLFTTGSMVSMFITRGFDLVPSTGTAVTWQHHNRGETWTGTGSFDDGTLVDGFKIYRTANLAQIRVRVYGIRN